MDLNDLPVFRMMAGKMVWPAARQRPLAENVSNADSPCYHPNNLMPVNLAKKDTAAGFGIALGRNGQ